MARRKDICLELTIAAVTLATGTASLAQAEHSQARQKAGIMPAPEGGSLKKPIESAIEEKGEGDLRVQITSPQAKQKFAPGDRVLVKVKLAPALKANDIAVSVYGCGRQEGRNYDGSSYESEFVIPRYLAGPLVLVPTITDQSNTFITGRKTIIAVVPNETPASLKVINPINFPSPHTSGNISVLGTYHYSGLPPAAIDRDLSSSFSGTHYKSSNEKVIAVDPDGCYRAEQRGVAVVTVENKEKRTYASFVVEDQQDPLPPQELTSQVEIRSQALRKRRGSYGFWADVMLSAQQLDIRNKCAVPLIGPLYLAIDGLPANVKAVMVGNSKRLIAGKDLPYVSLKLPGDGLTLMPGETTSVSLEFDSPRQSEIRYSARLFRSSAEPSVHP